MDLQKKMIASFLLVSLVPFGVGLTYSIKKAEPVVSKEINQKISSIQKAKLYRIKERIQGINRSLSIISRHRKFQDAFVQYEIDLKVAHEKYDGFLDITAKELGVDNLFFISNSGKVLTSSSFKDMHDFTFDGDDRLAKAIKDTLAKPYNAQEGIKFVDYIKEPYAKSEPMVYFISRFAPNSSQRGQWGAGESIGLVGFSLTQKHFNEIVNERTGLGKTGETYLVAKDSDGKSYYRSKRVVKKGEIGQKKGGKIIDMVLKDRPEFGFTEKIGSTGDKEVVFYAFIKEYGLNWAMFTTQKESEALASIYEIYKIAIFVGLIFAVAIGAFSYFFSKSITGPILNVVEKLTKGSINLNAASEDIEGQSHRLNEAATEQASGLQQTVSSVDEISAMIERNTDASTASTNLSKQSNDVARAGKSTIQDMIRAIEDINESNADITTQMKDSNEQISEIVQIINDIGEKTKVINDIVFQTKLLSFNASVEAARAGEHGKGFAVVAEEVGSLANMSGNAASEISDMLEMSTKKVEEIVNNTSSKVDILITKGREKVEHGTKIAYDCDKALDEILENVEKVNHMVGEIATASVEQSQGVQEINEAMRQLDTSAHQNSAVANESASSAKKLSQEAESLNGVVIELREIITKKKAA